MRPISILTKENVTVTEREVDFPVIDRINNFIKRDGQVSVRIPFTEINTPERSRFARELEMQMKNSYPSLDSEFHTVGTEILLEFRIKYLDELGESSAIVFASNLSDIQHDISAQPDRIIRKANFMKFMMDRVFGNLALPVDTFAIWEDFDKLYPCQD